MERRPSCGEQPLRCKPSPRRKWRMRLGRQGAVLVTSGPGSTAIEIIGNHFETPPAVASTFGEPDREQQHREGAPCLEVRPRQPTGRSRQPAVRLVELAETVAAHPELHRVGSMATSALSATDEPTALPAATPLVSDRPGAEPRRLPPSAHRGARKQTLPRESFEIIIADDGSTDGCADGLETGDGWIRVSHGPPLGSYGARNLAAAMARAPVPRRRLGLQARARLLDAGLAALEHADAAAGQVRSTSSYATRCGR